MVMVIQVRKKYDMEEIMTKLSGQIIKKTLAKGKH